MVYNLAMPGFGVDQMWLSVRHQGLPLEPDLVVVCLCDADFKRSLSAFRPEERMNKPLHKLVDGRLVPQTPADGPARSSTSWSTTLGSGWPAGL